MSTEIRFEPDPTSGSGVGSGSGASGGANFPIANQVTVTDAATVIAERRSGRGLVTIKNLGSTNVFVGNEDVTAAEGFELAENEGLTIEAENDVYAICASGSSTVSVIEDGP